MIYGITGNPHKNQLWSPVADLVAWLMRRDLRFGLHPRLAEGLIERDLVGQAVCEDHTAGDLAADSDVILSFGGDGTMLRTAHEAGPNHTPILGINIGRLGFLADIEVEAVTSAIEHLEAGRYSVEDRMVLEGSVSHGPALDTPWALNEFVIDRSGAAGLIKIAVSVDGTPLNTYWADGLIIATPTGSTAYSLSSGGPIIAPGTDATIITPIAPHTLTVRPLVLPSTVEIETRVLDGTQPYVLAVDGRSTVFEEHGTLIRIRRAEHAVHLVKLPDQHFFKTLRSKLMWGARSHMEDPSLPDEESVSRAASNTSDTASSS
jgi:NAD+ kinase